MLSSWVATPRGLANPTEFGTALAKHLTSLTPEPQARKLLLFIVFRDRAVAIALACWCAGFWIFRSLAYTPCAAENVLPT